MSSIDTADPAQLTDSSEDAIVAEVSAMLGGAETDSLEPPVNAAAATDMSEAREPAEAPDNDAANPTPIQMAEAEPLTEAAVEAALGQLETDLVRLQEVLNDGQPEIHIEPKTAVDQPVDEARVPEAAAETGPAAQDKPVATETAAQVLEDSAPATEIEAGDSSEAVIAEGEVAGEGELVEDMKPAREMVPASPEPTAEAPGESVEAAALEAAASEFETVVESDGPESQAVNPEPAAITQEQVSAAATPAANSGAAAPTEPTAPKPARRWYHPLRMVQGVAAALVEVLVLVDMPFAGLSPTIKAMFGCAGIATGAIAVATWGSVLYRSLQAG